MNEELLRAFNELRKSYPEYLKICAETDGTIPESVERCRKVTDPIDAKVNDFVTKYGEQFKNYLDEIALKIKDGLSAGVSLEEIIKRPETGLDQKFILLTIKAVADGGYGDVFGGELISRDKYGIAVIQIDDEGVAVSPVVGFLPGTCSCRCLFYVPEDLPIRSALLNFLQRENRRLLAASQQAVLKSEEEDVGEVVMLQAIEAIRRFGYCTVAQFHCLLGCSEKRAKVVLDRLVQKDAVCIMQSYEPIVVTKGR